MGRRWESKPPTLKAYLVGVQWTAQTPEDQHENQKEAERETFEKRDEDGHEKVKKTSV